MLPQPDTSLALAKTRLVTNDFNNPKTLHFSRSWKFFKVAQCEDGIKDGSVTLLPRYIFNLWTNIFPSSNSPAFNKNMPFDYAHMVAGCVAGGSSVALSHPMDTMKVRLQTGTGYKGAWDCVLKTFRREGVTGFYKGMGFPLVAASVYNSLVFFVYENFLTSLCKHKHHHEISDVAIASMGAGAVSVSVGTPIDLIKIKLQVQTESYKKVVAAIKKVGGPSGFLPAENLQMASKSARNISTSTMAKLAHPEVVLAGGAMPVRTNNPNIYSGPIRCVLDTVNKNGIRGLYRGAAAMLIRDIPGYAFYFVPYEILMGMMTPKDRKSSYGETAITACMAGGTAGTISWAVTHPLDTIKSRLQADTTGKYKGVIDCVRTSINNEGVGVFFRGFGMNALRGFPQSAALFLMYEMTMKMFENKKNKPVDISY